jgi:hypothetical protein
LNNGGADTPGPWGRFWQGSRPHVAALLLAGLWILWYPLAERPEDEGQIRGDPVQYFAYLQTIIEDGDLHFEDDYRELNPNIREQDLRELPTGYVPNYFAPGAPVLWSPFYLAGKVFVGVFGADDREHELSLLIAFVRFGSRFYAALSLIFIFLVLRRFFDPNYSLLGALAVFFGTSYFVYGLYNTILSHSAGAFMAALFIWLCLRTGPERGPAGWIILGAAAGFLTLCRWQDAVIVLWLAVEQAPRFFKALLARKGAVRMLLHYALSATVFIVMLVPQFVIWTILFGPFSTALDAGGNRVVWERPEIVNILFSSRHGLLAWHPLVYLGIVGLALLLWRDRLPAAASLVIFAVMVVLNSVTADWWAGDSFGHRRFISLSVFFALGIAAFSVFLKSFFRRFPQLVPGGLVVLLILWNLSLAGNYARNAIDHDRPPTFSTLVSGQVEEIVGRHGYPFAWPGNIFQSALVDGAPYDEADWILSTYLYYRQSNLNGRLLAEYPSYQGGFDPPARDRRGLFRSLQGSGGRVFVSRFQVLEDSTAVIDARLGLNRLAEGELPLLEITLNGRRAGLAALSSRIKGYWGPVYLPRPLWREGLNRLEIALFVGRSEHLSRYLEDGFDPRNDPSVRANDNDFSIRLYETRFFRGTREAEELAAELYKNE